MNSEHRIEKLLALYSLLLRMMPFEHRRKFSGEMEQLFCDRLRDAAREGVSLRRQALGMFAETLREIILQKVIEMKEARITHWVGSATLGILMIPLIGMQFSSEIKWTVFDFAVAGTAGSVAQIA